MLYTTKDIMFQSGTQQVMCLDAEVYAIFIACQPKASCRAQEYGLAVTSPEELVVCRWHLLLCVQQSKQPLLLVHF